MILIGRADSDAKHSSILAALLTKMMTRPSESGPAVR